MSYSLSFSNEFFYENSDCPNETNKPCSVYESLYNLYINDRKEFSDIVTEVLCYALPDYLPDMLIYELVDKCKEYNACRNLNIPVEVYINENHSVLVY